MSSVVVLKSIIVNDSMLNDNMLSFIILNAIMLSVVMLRVVAQSLFLPSSDFIFRTKILIEWQRNGRTIDSWL
jgi:hypothetical protein